MPKTAILLKWLNKLGFGEARCSHCGSPYFPDSGTPYLCSHCQIELAPYIGPRCPKCGLPDMEQEQTLQHNHFKLRKECVNCARTSPAWHKIAYHGLYAGALRDMLLRFKFDSELSLSNPLADFMVQASSCLDAPDALVPIPQHPAHLRKRGYNQAHELAKKVAAMGRLPFAPQLLERTSQQKIQEGLTAEQRRQNLANSFRAKRGVSNLHIWLVDDVLTTGSTCQAACKALLDNGARKVSVLTCARTPL